MLFDVCQREAVEKLKTGSILCGKVGSGKSRTALAYYFEKECGGRFEPFISNFTHPKDLYIITTAKKRDEHEWEDEIKAFGYPKDQMDRIKITIDSWNNIKKYVDAENSFFIFDEQRLVGKGAWVKSFWKITSSGVYRHQIKNNNWILLSATPGDKWDDYIPVFVANKFYRCRSEFLYEHAIFSPFTSYSKIDRFIGEAKLLKLKESILVDIPTFEKERDINYIKVDYDRDQYKRVTRDRWDIFKNEPIQNAAVYCYVLRKVVNFNSHRLVAIMDIFKNQRKLIVFYNFDYELDMLHRLASVNNIPHAEWNGHKHQQIPDTDSWMYFVQYSAGCEGWNCIQTDTIVFFSLNYSYRITEQASGRIDRRNSPYDVLHYYYIITDAWIDRAIKKALDAKKTFNKRKYFKDFRFA